LTAPSGCDILIIFSIKEDFNGLQTQRSRMRHHQKDYQENSSKDQEKVTSVRLQKGWFCAILFFSPVDQLVRLFFLPFECLRC